MPAVTATRPLATCTEATSSNVGRLRHALHRWLGEALGDDPDVVDDLTLAASEALENAADHAFVESAAVGTMWLRAVDDGDRITIVVTDDGCWQPPAAADAGHRGRGIDLMNRLVDISRVQPGAGGTSVTLVHHRVPAPRHRRD
ncbi:ATP-binding protein [Actinomycetospora flava]|uniref:ATP-binding protein n=1 Tax=Actinomycetospora flava TaxID=3129232 RepID=A0ABU8ME80_9PSEU